MTMTETRETYAERRRQWLADLRSGEFAQTTDTLRRIEMTGEGDSYCCLGVACERYRRETQTGEWRADGAFVAGAEDEFKGSSSEEMPEAVRKWYGLSQNDPEIFYHDGLMHVSQLNDRKNEDFATIADLLEAHWKKSGVLA